MNLKITLKKIYLSYLVPKISLQIIEEDISIAHLAKYISYNGL